MKRVMVIASLLVVMLSSAQAYQPKAYQPLAYKSTSLNVPKKQSRADAPVIATDKAHLIALSKDVRVKAFLDLLAHGEGTSYHPNVKISTDQYRISFCNKGKLSSFKDHPREKCCNPVGSRIICATAAGRYMFLEKTWDWVKDRIELRDFSPANQDLAAVFLLVISGAMQEILHNNIKGAIAKASRFWAPMPGNMYNQPQTKESELLGVYNNQLKFHQSFNLSYPQRKGRQ